MTRTKAPMRYSAACWQQCARAGATEQPLPSSTPAAALELLLSATATTPRPPAKLRPAPPLPRPPCHCPAPLRPLHLGSSGGPKTP